MLGIVLDLFVETGQWLLMIIRTINASFRRPPSLSVIIEKFFQIGVLSLPVVAITGFSTGLVLAAQAFFQLGDKGLASATGLLVGKGMLTEIGPVLTAFMVTGRVGSAMTAELGTMRVTEQIAALRSMCVNPLQYLVAPRVLAMTLMLPLLNIFSALTGIFGGYLISINVFHMTPQGYFDPMPANIPLFDIYTGLVKAVIFGFLISTISCYKGMNAAGGAEGVGRSTTSSVVVCYIYILVINFLLTIGMDNLHTYLQESFGWR
jgi:phospholipid/cholesterol/gamma-HCH transport system permease protein